VSHDPGHGEPSHTLSHKRKTSLSASCLQFIRLSIQPSKVGMDCVSVTGDKPCGWAGLPTSTSIFESMLDSMLNCFSAVFAGGRVYRVRRREGRGREGPFSTRNQLRVNRRRVVAAADRRRCWNCDSTEVYAQVWSMIMKCRGRL